MRKRNRAVSYCLARSESVYRRTDLQNWSPFVSITVGSLNRLDFQQIGAGCFGDKSESVVRSYLSCICYKIPSVFVVSLFTVHPKSGPRWMVLLPSLGRMWLPAWFLIPVHVIIYVPYFTELHTAPYAHIPLHTIPKLRLHSLQVLIIRVKMDAFIQNFRQNCEWITAYCVRKTSEGINHRRELYDFDILIRWEDIQELQKKGGPSSAYANPEALKP